MGYDYREAGDIVVLALYLPVYVVSTVVSFFVSTLRRARVIVLGIAAEQRLRPTSVSAPAA